MARPREFDEAVALDAAVRCFWENGYKGTSTRVLAATMGITGASVYNAFGCKRDLYVRAIARYFETSVLDRVGRFEGRLPPLAAIAAFFDEIVQRSLGDPDRKGCMLVNAALEYDAADEEMRGVVVDVQVQIEAFFRRCVTAGQLDGSMSLAHPADDLAGMLLATLLGIRVLARTRAERSLLEGAVKPVLALLQGSAPAIGAPHG
jgi:TetR/AcrR family transcriptional repressor of nem operon